MVVLFGGGMLIGGMLIGWMIGYAQAQNECHRDYRALIEREHDYWEEWARSDQKFPPPGRPNWRD